LGASADLTTVRILAAILIESICLICECESKEAAQPIIEATIRWLGVVRAVGCF
jgi:hypothetical protein